MKDRPATTTTNSSNRFRILCIDGGGLRGIYAAHILARMEEEYAVKWDEHFHLLSGTSTGSIIAAGLVCGLSARAIVGLYREHGTQIFARRGILRRGIWKSKYSSDYLHRLLREVFEDRTLGEIKIPLILPATDIGNGCVHVFKSFYDEEFVRDRDVFIRDAVLASCSAPTYLDPFSLNGTYILADGGLWANSPSLVAVIEAKRRLSQRLDRLRVLSIGTGAGRSFYPQKQSWWKRLQGWGFATRWEHRKFISMLLNLQAETAHNMTKLILDPGQLLRINFSSDTAISLDDPADLNDLISRADKDFSHKAAEIGAFTDLSEGDF